MKASSQKPRVNFALYGLRVSSRGYWLSAGLVLLALLACTQARAANNQDFAVVFRCEENSATLCLVGQFPGNQRVALVSERGRQCQAFTKDSFKYEGPTDWIPATRMDTAACSDKDLAFAVLSQEKGELRVGPLQEIVDPARISALNKSVSNSGLLRFNERKYREENPVPLNDEHDQWQGNFDTIKAFYAGISRSPRVYRASITEQEVLLLQYSLWRLGGPVLLMVGGKPQLLELQGWSPVAFEIGGRRYLFLRWNKGEGGYHGSSVWEIDEKGAREVFGDASFST